jgi:hypothetical protein
VSQGAPANKNASESRIHVLVVLQDGLVSGLLGAFTVAVAHLVADIGAGEPFRTPTLLGVLLFDGVQAARAATPSFAVSFRFTIVHIASWVVLGTIGSYLVSLVDSRPRLASIIFGGFAFVFISLSYLSGAYSLPGLPALHLWLGTLVGSAAAAGYLLWRHPKLGSHIRGEHLTETTRSEIAQALAHETAAAAVYAAAARRYPESVLASLLEEKQGRARTVQALADDLGLPSPADPASELPCQAESPEEAIRQALVLERETIAFYDRFLTGVPELKVRDVFLRLRYHALDDTIPQLENALS